MKSSEKHLNRQCCHFLDGLALRMRWQQVADANATALTQALKACAQLGGPRGMLTSLVRKMEVGKFGADLGAWWAINNNSRNYRRKFRS